MRPCVTGSPISTIRFILLVRWPVPIPYPAMVRDFQTVIGREARTQIVRTGGQLPMHWSPVWAVVLMPWACSILSWMMRSGYVRG